MEADRIGGVNGGANGLFGTNTHHRRKKGKRRKDDMFVENKVKKAKVEPTKFSFKNLPNLKLKFVTQSAKKVPSSPAASANLAKTTFASAEMQSPTRLKLKLSVPGPSSHSKETWSSSVNGTHLKIKMNGQHNDKPRPESSEPAKNGPRKGTSDKKKTARRGQTQFKKVTDLDLFCGTRSLFVQVNDDLNECLYCGDERLVRKFLSPHGLSLQDVKEFLANATDLRKENFASERAHRESAKLVTGDYSDDDDYAPSVKDKKEATKEKRKEIQQKLLNREYIENDEERNRVFRSHKDNLVSKILESDKACSTKSFLLILNPDMESATYHGYKEFLAYFFTCGFSANHLDRKYNIRMRDNDELDSPACSVPHCTVSRNLLSKWRIAAMELYKFPDNLPMTLYNCPKTERKEWIKRLGLEATFNGKIAVCSFHFEDGAPTRKNPHPSIFLSPGGPEVIQFQGALELPKETTEEMIPDSPKDNFTKISYKRLKPPHQLSDRSRRKIYANYKPFWKTLKKSVQPSQSRLSYLQKMSFRSLARAKQTNRIRCKFCVRPYKSVEMYYQHACEVHFKIDLKGTDAKTMSQPECCHPESIDLPTGPANTVVDPPSPPKSTTVGQMLESDPVEISPSEFDEYMKMFYPVQIDDPRKNKSTYFCKSCKVKFTPEEFYTHLRKTHESYFCVFCDQLFKKFVDIEKHLKLAHHRNVPYFHSPQLFSEYAGSQYVLTCGICFSEIDGEELSKHECQTLGPKVFECPQCPKAFPNQESLEIHLCNGLCRDPVKDEKEALKRFRVLTGKHPQHSLLEKQTNHEIQEAPILKQPPNGILKAALSRPVKPKPLRFDPTDKQILSKVKLPKKEENKTGFDLSLWDNLPESGSIFLGVGAQGITSDIRKVYKDSAHKWVIPNSQNGQNDRNLTEILQAGSNFFLDSKNQKQTLAVQVQSPIEKLPDEASMFSSPGNMSDLKLRLKMPPIKNLPEQVAKPPPSSGISLKISLPPTLKLTPPPPQKKESKIERVARQASKISNCLEKMSRLIDSFGEKENCLFCQQSKFLAVDTIFLLTHLIVNHNRDDVEKNLEEDPADSILRIRNQLKDLKKDELIFEYVSLTATESNSVKYNCCYCEKKVDQSVDELFVHMKKEHNSDVMKCWLCQSNFLNYGSFASHVCFGPVQPKSKFICPICHDRDISSFMGFLVHVRQIHNVCDFCMKSCENQANLQTHCLSHSQELMCMKCFVNNDDTNQFRKHLFNFHDNEHTTCTKCHQKTWSFVYHFCFTPESATCEVCDKRFEDFKHYRVHLRTHTGSNPHVCTARGCKKSYISKQLLLKHQVRRHQELRAYAAKTLEDKRTQRQLARYGAKSLESLQIVEATIMDLIDEAIRQSELKTDTPEIEKEPEVEKTKTAIVEAPTFLDPVDAAVRSIMGPEGSFSLGLSPTKDLSSLLSPSPLHHLEPELPMFNSNLPLDPPSKDFVDQSSRSAQQPNHLTDITNNVPTKEKTVLQDDFLKGSEKAPSVSESTEEVSRVSQIAPKDILPLSGNQQEARTKVSPGGLPRKGCKILKPRIAVPSPAKVVIPVSAASPKPLEPQISAIKSPMKPDLSETAPKEEPCSTLLPESQAPSNEPSIISEPSSSEVPNTETCQNQDEIKNNPSLDTDKSLTESKQDSSSLPEGPPTLLSASLTSQPRVLTTFDAKTITEKLESGGWDVLLSENSEDDDVLEELKPKKPRIIEREVVDKRLALKDHDYTYNSFQISRLPPTPPPQPVPATPVLPPPPPVSLLLPKFEDLSEMDKIANNVAMGLNSDDEIWNKKEGKKKKKKRKKHRKRHNSSSDSDSNVPIASSTPSVAFLRGPKPKYHTSLTGHGVTAGAARPRFSSSSDSDASSADTLSDHDLATSDYDTDFSADETPKISLSATSTTLSISTKISAVTPIMTSSKRTLKPTAKIAALKLLDQPTFDEPSPTPSPNVTLKIKMPPMLFNGQPGNVSMNKSLVKKSAQKKRIKSKKRPLSLNGFAPIGLNGPSAKRQRTNGSSSDSDSTEGELQIVDKFESRRFQQTENEKIFCICRGAKDNSSSMIGCDGQNCILEWFHFECVGIKQPPAGRWYCPDCRRRYGYTDSSFLV